MKAKIVTDPEKCKLLWKNFMRVNGVSDLWEFRMCFQKHFNWDYAFLLLEDKMGPSGILPLSYVPDMDMFVLFPGELWLNKTWLERTPIYARNPSIFGQLLALCPEPAFLRYLDVAQFHGDAPELAVDENGYVLYPGILGYDIRKFYERFRKKRLKTLFNEISSLETRRHRIRINRRQDFGKLVEMNIRRYGNFSYLYDSRFCNSFFDVMNWLYEKNFLYMVSVEVKGKVAAVDLGAIYHGVCTIFLGGADPELPGIAKLINLYHIRESFRQRFRKLDFLCGDFNWKKLWHLDMEPLYKFSSPSTEVVSNSSFKGYSMAELTETSHL